MNIINNTPVEIYRLKSHRKIMVKREDLATQPPGPPFSKVRGLMSELKKYKKLGITVVGYTETAVSMAGWGVAWACSELNMKAVIFDPQYKESPELLKYHRSKWKEFKAEIRPIKAGMAKVGWNISRNLLREEYGESFLLLPLGLPFLSSVKETYKEAISTRKNVKSVDRCSSVIVNVGSGTIAAGVLKAFSDKHVYGIMGRTGDVVKKAKQISLKSGIPVGGMVGASFKLIDPGWGYTDRSFTKCPFPCHPYYDLKAWEWLEESEKGIPGPILFWNIGSIAV